MSNRISVAQKRSYGDDCPTAHGLDLIGERWALLIVRELMIGPRRFKDIQAGLTGISPNVLTQRLDELEAAGIVVRRKLPPPNSVWAYELTEWGKGLEPVMQALGRWAVQSPVMAGKERRLRPVSFVLSLRARFDRKRAGRRTTSLTLVLDEQSFAITYDQTGFVAVAGEAPFKSARIQCSPYTLYQVMEGQRSLARAIRSGDIKVEGDPAAVDEFVNLFSPEQQPVST